MPEDAEQLESPAQPGQKAEKPKRRAATSYPKRSASFVPLHRNRQVKGYLVLDAELSVISAFNGAATLCLSLATTFAGMGFGLWANIFTAGAPSELVQLYGILMERIFFGLGALFVALAVMCFRWRNSTVDRVKRESEADGELDSPQ